jgi:trigger factor
MNFTLTKHPGSIVEISVTVSPEQVDKYLNKVSSELSQKVKIPGFRKGHVPKAILEQHFGQEGLMEMAADKIIQQSYAEIIIKEQIHVVGRPVDVELKSTEPFVYSIKAPVYPEVKISDYSDIKITPSSVTVTEEEIDTVAAEMRESMAEYKEIDTEAKEGHKVEMDFEGFTPDGVPLENTASKNHPAILGQKQFIPGFEENIVGMKAGDEKEFLITFPTEYHAANMAGKEVKFKIKVHKVWDKILPELTEEFLKNYTGEDMTVENFRAKIREEILKEKEKKEEGRREEELITALIKKTEVDMPETFIEEELHQMLHDQKHYIQDQGIDYDMYLSQMLKKTEGELKADWKDRAHDRVMSKLVVTELVKKENITITDEELDAKVEEIVMGYPGPDSQKKAKEIYRPNGKYYEPLRERMKVEKLMSMLLERFSA